MVDRTEREPLSADEATQRLSDRINLLETELQEIRKLGLELARRMAIAKRARAVRREPRLAQDAVRPRRH